MEIRAIKLGRRYLVRTGGQASVAKEAVVQQKITGTDAFWCRIEGEKQIIPEVAFVSEVRSEPPAGHRNSPFTLMSSIVQEAVEWLWQPYIPLGELAIMDGDPGSNKSSLLDDLAARVSAGNQMPDGTGGVQGGVLLLVAEDSLRKTVCPRLIAAGAEMNRVGVIERSVTIPHDLNLIEEAAVKLAAKLIVIDPLMVFVAKDANNDQSVRQALMPLKDLAERLNVAVVMVRHLNKTGGRQSLYRGSGSIGIIATTRSGLLVAKDPHDPHMRVLCQYKSNLGPLGPSLLFEPVERGGAVGIEWRGECEYSAADLLIPVKGGGRKLEEAKKVVLDLLIDGPKEQVEIQSEAATFGISWRTMERAKAILGIVSRRQGFGPGSAVWWELPRAE